MKQKKLQVDDLYVSKIDGEIGVLRYSNKSWPHSWYMHLEGGDQTQLDQFQFFQLLRRHYVKIGKL
jgi:hypothetical protein